MKKLLANFLLLLGLVLPVPAFLVPLSRGALSVLAAAIIAIVVGWALNIAWAYTAQGSSSQGHTLATQNYPTIAKRFGWACPAVLVLLAWLVWRFALGHST